MQLRFTCTGQKQYAAKGNAGGLLYDPVPENESDA